MPCEPHEPRRFRFGPTEPGLLGGFRPGQVGVIAAGLLAMLLMLRLAGGTGGGLLALATGVSAVAVAFAPLGGRTVEQWAPLAAGYFLRRLTGRHRHLSETPVNGSEVAVDGRFVVSPPGAQTPRSLRGVRILGFELTGEMSPQGPMPTVGVLREQDGWTGVLAVAGPPFTLLDQADKERRVAAWGGVLATLARPGSPVSRVQWIERTAAQPMDESARYLRDHVALPLAHTSVRSYIDLLDAAAPAARQHELLLALRVDGRRARRLVRRRGGGDRGGCEVLVGELAVLTQALRGADVVVKGALTPRLLAGAIRVGFDPNVRAGLEKVAGADPERAGCDPGLAWPLAAVEGWGAYRSEGAVHAAYWIAEWPRTDVTCDVLAPLLLGSDARRNVAVTIEPVDPIRAIRQVESARVNDLSDDEVRARAGFLRTARRRREQESLARREEEIADGHAALRFSGYVSVSAASDQELEVACAEVEQAAQRARLVLQRMWGEQELGFTYTLPLCRGLR